MAAEEEPQQLHRSALLTEWGANVTAENAWREYPRPQLVRGEASWRCLNGLWEYAISAASAPPRITHDAIVVVKSARVYWSSCEAPGRAQGADRKSVV